MDSINIVQILLFWSITTVCILCTLGIIFIPQILYSIVAMIILFAGTGCLFIMLNSDFLGLAQILIYATAVSILFLFAVMFVKIDYKEKFKDYLSIRNFFALFGAGIVFLSLIFCLTNGFGIFNKVVPIFKFQLDFAQYGISFKNTFSLQALGEHLLKDYIFAFEILSLLILISITGIALLALKIDKTGANQQEREADSDF